MHIRILCLYKEEAQSAGESKVSMKNIYALSFLRRATLLACAAFTVQVVSGERKIEK